MSLRQVVTVADVGYVPYLACFLLSLGERASPNHPLQVTIIHRAIPSGVRGRLRDLVNPPHHVRWFDPTSESLQFSQAVAATTTSPHYLKLLTPFAVQEATRGIYIDADTIITGDLSSLWTLDLRGNVIAAARDCLPFVCDAIGNHQDLGLSPKAPYFNSGVLVIDTERWRAERVTQRVLETCAANAEHLSAQGKWPQHDQYGLNVVLGRQWLPLAREWNQWAFSYTPEARIVHYLGDSKPHLPACAPVFGKLYSDTLARTTFGEQTSAASC